MSGHFWRLPLVISLALLAAAASLVTYARAHHAAHTPVQLAPALRPPPDGLARAKRAAARAVETETLRVAVARFHECEGRAPSTLYELAATGYLRDKGAPADLRRYTLDPATLTIAEVSQ